MLDPPVWRHDDDTFPPQGHARRASASPAPAAARARARRPERRAGRSRRPAPSGSASASPAPARPDRAGQADARGRQTELAEKLAKELGVDQAKVQAALDKIQAEQQAQAKADRLAALKQRLDQAVTDGKLTQAEADAIYKAAENGVLPQGGAAAAPATRPRTPRCVVRAIAVASPRGG